MAKWQSYPDFAHLFDALLQANGISVNKFADIYRQATGKYSTTARMESIQEGRTQPSYELVTDIADHALLSLDPTRLRPVGESGRGIDYRIALFSAAGLIEVTPSTISQWNQDVMAGWQRRLAEPARQKPNWKELMYKLVDFHLQGGRWTIDNLADAANAEITSGSFLLNAQRVNDLLTGGAVATDTERIALARAVGLSPEHIHQIQTAVEDGTLPLRRRLHTSTFSTLLNDFLERLHSNHISVRELARRSVPVGQTEPTVHHATISGWKRGRGNPTLSPLRGLVCGLERCQRLVTPSEISELVSAAGFTQEDLVATTHDIVNAIGDTTRLKPLLVKIRNAADLDVPTSILSDEGDGLAVLVKDWENERNANSPSPSQARELLGRYNRVLRDKGEQELDSQEIEKIMTVANRDRQEGLEKGFLNRAQQHRPRVARRAITPDFDDGPNR
jgi:hypothetical protein